MNTAKIPDGGGELRLFRRGNEYSIMLGSNELMNSRLSGSEEALASLSCERITSRKRPHILIGGLGMGFTLRQALTELPSDAHITVAELVPEIVDWARGPMQRLYGNSLNDPRVNIEIGDVTRLIRSASSVYDAILLDVDNGPDGLTQDSNEALYSFAGLKAAKAALRKDGALAIWSCAPDAKFTRRLKDCGFRVEEFNVRARGDKGAHHVIWLAQN